MLPDSIRHLKGEDLKNAIPDKIYISLKDMRILTKVDMLMPVSYTHLLFFSYCLGFLDDSALAG